MERQVFERWRETLLDTNVLILAILPATVLLHNVACFGFWCGMTILSCYLAGVYCCHFVEREWWSSVFWRIFFTEADVSATSYARKKDTVTANSHERVFASRPIDQALDQIFCRIADQYISTWYSHISSDARFQYEVRSALRRIVCSIYERIASVNLEHFVLDKVVPICLAHATSAQKNVEISRLHVAVHSRKSEVMYVQNLSRCVLKFLLPTYDLNCRSYAILLRQVVSKSVILSLSDAICNPCVLNQLILRHLEMKEKTLTDHDGGGVGGGGGGNGEIDYSTLDKPSQLLQNFVNVYETSPNDGSLRPDLNAILKDKELQNTFMRYLKSENAEHVLQFCLDIASFNEKILKPELEAEELDDLYRDAWDLFSVYFSSYSPNCIHFHKDLATPLRKALSKDILKLRTTATLFEAYEYAFSILENRCQDFHNSAEFYRWLYGRCDYYDSTSNEIISMDPSYSMLHCVTAKESFGRKTMAEIGQKFSKIKDALKADSVLDGRLCGDDDAATATATAAAADFSDRASETQEHRYTEVGVDVQLAPIVEKKNINNWKISISTVGPRLDPATDTVYTVFAIRIVDESDKSEWLVERRLIDVHSLHAKLVEFYGKTLADLELAALKSEIPPEATTSIEDALVYEEYLKKLIGCAELNDSQLLYNFFTSVERVDEQGVADASVTGAAAAAAAAADDDDDDDDQTDDSEEDDYENEDTSLSKIFRKSVVGPTLRKERGQNLETFVNSLINSCVTAKYERKDVGGEKKSCCKKTNLGYKSNQVYGNNFDVDANRTRETVLAGKSAAANFSNRARLTPFSLAIYAAYKIYNLRTELTRILVCFKCAFGNVADQLIFKITRSHLKQMAVERKVAYFINTIEWAVFDNKINYSEHRVRETVTSLLSDMSDNWLFSAYQLIFQTLQDAKRNKQLFYNLCDVLMEELFPEIFAHTYARANANE